MRSAVFFEESRTAAAANFASPSDLLVRHGRRERAAQFGLSDEHEESFELNQSFPRLSHKAGPCLLTPEIKGCELSSINFIKPPTTTKKSYLLNDTVYSPNPNVTTTNNKSWLFYNQFVNTRALLNCSSSWSGGSGELEMVSNPNKAVVVMNGRTSEILTANDVACELFGVADDRLSGRLLRELLVASSDDDDQDDLDEGEAATGDEAEEILMESDRLDEQGRAVLCSGKILDALVESATTNGARRMPVSVYIVKLNDDPSEPRCLCVMEPIQRVTGSFAINLKVPHSHTHPVYS